MKAVAYFKWREELKLVLIIVITFLLAANTLLMLRHCSEVERQTESIDSIAKVLSEAQIILTE